MSKRDMGKKFGIAYTDSNRTVRVTIPDAVHFPHDTAWVYMRDRRTVVLSPIKPPSMKLGAFNVPLNRHKALRDCRSAVFGPVTGLGDAFRMCDAEYRAEGQDLLVFFPERLLPPIKRGKAKLQAAEPKEAAVGHLNVLVELEGKTHSFSVPESELHGTLVKWLLAGYGS